MQASKTCIQSTVQGPGLERASQPNSSAPARKIAAKPPNQPRSSPHPPLPSLLSPKTDVASVSRGGMQQRIGTSGLRDMAEPRRGAPVKSTHGLLARYARCADDHATTLLKRVALDRTGGDEQGYGRERRLSPFNDR